MDILAHSRWVLEKLTFFASGYPIDSMINTTLSTIREILSDSKNCVWKWWFVHILQFTLPLFMLFLTIIYWDLSIPRLKRPIQRALADNFIHTIIGLVSWMTISARYRIMTPYNQMAIESILCGSIASLIDLDHFVAARSFYLKDATNLKGRPPLHCSTFPLVTSLLLLSVALVLKVHWLFKLACIIFTAFAGHHVRDATRRGLWFYPFGSTPPIPYALHVLIIIAIPYVVLLLMNFTNFSPRFRQIPWESEILIF